MTKWALAFTTFIALLLTGCGGGGDDSSDTSSNTTNTDTTVTDTDTDTGTTTGDGDDITDVVDDVVDDDNNTGGDDSFLGEDVEMSFNLSGAVSLITSQEVIESSTSSSSGFGSSESGTGATNLLAVDELGVAVPAIDTNYPVKTMYTVASPSGQKVYVALDPGWMSWDPNQGNYDFSQVISANNCALLEIDLITNSFSCAAEGVLVQPIDDSYMKAISGNQKPIQFDASGNMYFAATSFTQNYESWNDCYWDEASETEVCEEYTYYWLEQSDWNPRIYKRDISGNVETVTQDTEHIDFFVVLSSGELVYQSRTTTDWQANLKLLQGSSIIDLSGDNWGVDFFTVDDENTVIFGQADWSGSGANGVRFARPRTEGGVEKASLDTSLFGASNNSNGWGNPKPRRLLVGDNGQIFGVFEGGRDVYDDNGNWSSWTSTLTVYQLLPFDGVPKLELDLGNEDWWSWMQNTPFQISGDYLYYKDTVDVPFLGTADVIVMVDIETREHTTLLDPTSEENSNTANRFDIYNWRLADNILHFSGLNKVNNEVITGEIDAQAFADGEDDFLTLTEVSSAYGAISQIQDIEVLVASDTTVNDGTNATAIVYQNMDNLYSMSIEFSKPMNRSSVESYVTLTSSDTSENIEDDAIPFMPVWVNQSLHLIPDLDDLSDSSSTTPMSRGETYTLRVQRSAKDEFNMELDSTINSAITMKPSSGWYVDTNTYELKFAGRPANDSWSMETYDIADVDEHFRFTFEAQNFSWEGLELVMYEVDSDQWNTWDNRFFSMYLSNWSNLDVKVDDGNSGYMTTWDSGETRQIFNGEKNSYRLSVYGSNLELAVKAPDASDYTVVETLSRDDLADRDSSADYRLLVRLSSPLLLDNLVVEDLDSNGDVTSDPAIFEEDFDDATAITDVPAEFATDVSDTTGFEDL